MSTAVSNEEPSLTPRLPRSRLDRPCDTCRRLKHMCTIPVRGEPCQSCRLRRKTCTFDKPPTSRKRKWIKSPGSQPLQYDSTLTTNHNSENPLEITTEPCFAQLWDSSNAIGGTFERFPNTVDYNENNMEGHRSLVLRNGGLFNSIPPPVSIQSQNHPATATTTLGLPSDSATFHPTLLGNEADLPLSNLPSLDLDPDMDQESHYLGSLAISSFTIPDSSSSNAGSSSALQLSLRQVSSDPKAPVFFMKSPSLLYGRAHTTGRTSFDAVCKICGGQGSDILTKALTSLKQVTLPAVPIINIQRLELACQEHEGGGPVPYALLAGVIAHSTQHNPEIRNFHKEVWSQALLGLDNEYRLPRLATLQLALLQLYSRPMENGENSGQVEIGLARAVGAAQLLGLHVDPTKWSLPLWERTLRKHIWWALVIQDKWRALLYGRPSKIHLDDQSVPLPVVLDGTSRQQIPASDQSSYETFIATCRLTIFIDKILREFFMVKATVDSSLPISRVGSLEQCLKDLIIYEQSLPQSIQYSPLIATPLTGVRSFQLSGLGLHIVIHRLLFQHICGEFPLQTLQIFDGAMKACQAVVDFMAGLGVADRNSYWAPYSSHHLSNTLNLLLGLQQYTRTQTSSLSVDPMVTLTAFVDTLITLYGSDRWDISGLALRRAFKLFTQMEDNLPEVSTLTLAISNVLGIAQNASADCTAQMLASIGFPQVDADILHWLEPDFSWLTDFPMTYE